MYISIQTAMLNKAEKREKEKSYYFSIYNNGACIRSRMERKYYQEARNRRKERDVGEIHRWIGTRPGPPGKKAKKTHDQVYIAFILFLFFP